jgi:hypothetical protein
MNPLIIFLLVGGGALLLSNANKANITAATSQVLLTGVRINTSKLLAPYFELTFNIFNTIDSNLTLQAISGSVYYQGNPVASIQYASNTQIKKGDNFITVKAIPDNISILRQLIGIIGGKFTRDLTVQGTAIVNGIQVPIKNSLF